MLFLHSSILLTLLYMLKSWSYETYWTSSCLFLQFFYLWPSSMTIQFNWFLHDHTYKPTHSNDPSSTLTIKSLFPSAPWSTYPIEMLNIFFHFHKPRISLYSIPQSKKIHVLDIAKCSFQVPILHHIKFGLPSHVCKMKPPSSLYIDILIQFYLRASD